MTLSPVRWGPDAAMLVAHRPTRHLRLYACACSFFLFAVYYFTKFCQLGPAPSHEQFYEDLQDLVAGVVEEAAWIAYRESVKDSIAQIGLLVLITRKQVIDTLRHHGDDMSHWDERLYINVDPHDKANVESILFDVVAELQANDLLIQNFGHLLQRAANQRTKRSSSARPTRRCVAAYNEQH